MKHYVREMHDVVAQPVSIWCNAGSWNHSCSENVEAVDCEDCLRAAAKYGIAAIEQLVQLRKKN